MRITANGLRAGKNASAKFHPKALSERAVTGLHNAAFRELTQHLAASSSILDLGAGTGAWAARLLTHGHQVTCLDRNADAFMIDNVPLVQADLNEDFGRAIDGQYDAVTAIEVIEHLENPTNFLRQCRKLLAERGILLITTPNIECVAGRLRFLLTGNLRMFGENESFNDPTHISPIQSYMFEKMTRAAGLRVLSHKTSQAESPVSGHVARMLSRLVGPFVKGFKVGDNHIFTLEL